jgi:pimeloyl-ACP methyl ester carboxylesterase
MAADTVGLLDVLGIGSAHIVGASMGGMIAQQVAIDFPERVRSLCSIMSTTGAPAVGQPSPEALGLVLAPRPDGREAAIDRTQSLFAIIGSPDFPTPPEEVRRRVSDAYDRAYTPEGATRQIAAIATAPDRTAALGKVEVPAVVIHGDHDKLVDVSGGYATAAALGIEPVILKGAGHDLPAQLWDVYVSAIVKNARRAAAV